MKELLQAIRKTRPTAPGRDGISSKLLRELTDENMCKILGMFRNLFETLSVPPSWKEATIVPICKPGKPAHLVSSYRPIALTSVLSKVFERILLQRLVIWAGRKNLFHQSHFGFMPFKDCTAGLSKLYDDLSHARASRLSAIAVCLDIKAAYDSIWIDGLIYKLATLGIRGKMGSWIAGFLTNRFIRIRWKNTYSDVGPCWRGVPQGSVLSPFLFTIFMSDVFEVLESGAHLLVYADDIVMYAIGQNPSHTLDKLQNCIDRLSQWCKAYNLTISPDKSLAIDFSRRKQSEKKVRVMGSELEWSPVVKVLGVWFSRSLVFNNHFSYLRKKAVKRINYIRAIVSCSRGVRSYHMIYIVNALIRSLLEYACPLFVKASRSSVNTLEVIYNAALRTATGLPRCTPLPLLRREANSSSIASRLKYLAHCFVIRQLSLPFPVLGSPSNLSPVGHLSSFADELLSLYRLVPGNLLKFSWPFPLHLAPEFRICTDGLPFQIPSLPPSTILQAWNLWSSSTGPCIIIASDASKDNNKTAVAGYNATEGLSFAFLIPHMNSVFTAEALALYLAISLYVKAEGNYILISDSLSVLSALQNVSIRSPRIIIMIYNVICNHLQNTSISLTLIWCPGHSGIPANEMADSLARNGPYSDRSLNLIAPEDLLTTCRRDWDTEKLYEWINSEYYAEFSHLDSNQDYRRWTCNRQEDVWLSRWRTRMWLTNHRLFKMNLVPSPQCAACCVDETPEHILFSCGRYTSARLSLFASLNISPPVSFSNLMDVIFRSRKGVAALVWFSSVCFAS